MPWARLDDTRHDHPKILALGDDLYALAAVGILDHAITWASRHTKRGTETHGLVPWTFWRTRGTRHWKRLTDALLAAGLVDADEQDRGLWVHDFPSYGAKRDPSEAAASGRKGAANRKAAGGYSHPNSQTFSDGYSHTEPDGCSHEIAVANDASRTYPRVDPRASAPASPTRPDPTRPDLSSFDGPLQLADAHDTNRDHQKPQEQPPDEHEQAWLDALTDAISSIRPGWAPPLIRAAIRLGRQTAGWQRLAVALVIVARDPTTDVPHRVLSPGYWWDETDTRRLAALDDPTVLALYVQLGLLEPEGAHA